MQHYLASIIDREIYILHTDHVISVMNFSLANMKTLISINISITDLSALKGERQSQAMSKS